VRRWNVDGDGCARDWTPVGTVPAALVHTAWQHRAHPRWAQAAVAAGLLVAGALIGAGGMWQWQGQRVAATLASSQAGTPAGWVQRAALAHSVYVPEPRRRRGQGQEEHWRWLAAHRHPSEMRPAR
jgi:hypothetical protein